MLRLQAHRRVPHCTEGEHAVGEIRLMSLLAMGPPVQRPRCLFRSLRKCVQRFLMTFWLFKHPSFPLQLLCSFFSPSKFRICHAFISLSFLSFLALLIWEHTWSLPCLWSFGDHAWMHWLVYRKATHTDWYIHFTSNHYNKVKGKSSNAWSVEWQGSVKQRIWKQRRTI